MARPRTLTDQQRQQSNAERQKRWRERNRGLAKLKVKNWRAAQKAMTIAPALVEPIKPKTGLPGLPHYGEIHYGPVEGVDVISQPAPPPIPLTIQPAQPLVPAQTPEPTAEESRVAAKLAQLIQRKLDDDLDFKA